MEKKKRKKEQLEKQRRKAERWLMLRWITQYIKENQDKWDERIIEKE